MILSEGDGFEIAQSVWHSKYFNSLRVLTTLTGLGGFHAMRMTEICRKVEGTGDMASLLQKFSDISFRIDDHRARPLPLFAQRYKLRNSLRFILCSSISTDTMPLASYKALLNTFLKFLWCKMSISGFTKQVPMSIPDILCLV